MHHDQLPPTPNPHLTLWMSMRNDYPNPKLVNFWINFNAWLIWCSIYLAFCSLACISNHLMFSYFNWVSTPARTFPSLVHSFRFRLKLCRLLLTDLSFSRRPFTLPPFLIRTYARIFLGSGPVWSIMLLLKGLSTSPKQDLTRFHRKTVFLVYALFCAPM